MSKKKSVYTLQTMMAHAQSLLKELNFFKDNYRLTVEFSQTIKHYIEGEAIGESMPSFTFFIGYRPQQIDSNDDGLIALGSSPREAVINFEREIKIALHKESTVKLDFSKIGMEESHG